MNKSDKRAEISAEDRQTVLRLLRDYVKPHYRQIAIAVFFMVIVAITTGATAWIVDPAIEEIFLKKNRAMLTILPLAVLAIILAQSAAEYVQAKILAFTGQKIVADLQTDLFRHVIHADQARLNTIHSGTFISNFLYDATLVNRSISTGIIGIGKNFTTLICLIAVMFYQDWLLALMAIAVFPVVLIVTRQLKKHMRKATIRGMDKTDQLSRLISETLRGARTVKAYRQEELETARATKVISERLDQLMAGVRARVRAAPLTGAFTAIGVAGIMAYGGQKGLNGDMTINEFVSFLTAMLMSYQPARALSQLNVVVAEGITAANRVLSIIDIDPEIGDPASAKHLDLQDGEIRLENVCFDYIDGTSALKDVSFVVPSGQTVALVGPSGAGKTTIFNMIPRFYDTKVGRILVDGQDVRDVTLESLRRVIAIVTQEPFLFDDSVRANIAYSRPSATEEQIEAAARNAAAHDFIVGLPSQYDTIVGESGVKLSGGQRQRLAIARAMLADTPILLLDEATSALDSESERQIQTALKRLMKDRTTLVIAHRLSTIIDADKIVVLDGGRVVEQGSHDELLAKRNLYASLYQTQFDLPQDGESSATPPKQAAGE